MSGTIPGTIYIHNCTNEARDRQGKFYKPGGFEVAVRLDYGTPNIKPVWVQPGQQIAYTPTKSSVKFQASADPFLRIKPAEWNTSFGMSKTSVHYYIMQSTTEFKLVADVKHP